MNWLNQCHFGDVRAVLKQMIADGVKVNTIVTSPPYWGLRSYLPADHPDKAHELGSEPTIQEFIASMTEVFMLAREVLADDGTAWVNMGDCYATGAGKVNTAPGGGTQGERWAGVRGDDKLPGIGPMTQPNRMPQPGLKPKDLVGQPWRLAFALQDAGWWLRQDIIWAKPSCMPESVTDRCTKSHEYIFLLAKSEKYYCDMAAIMEPIAVSTAGDKRTSDDGYEIGRPERGYPGNASQGSGMLKRSSGDPTKRNKRSVWTVASQPYSGAHFATFPPALIEPCIVAGARAGGTVLDIFMGSGTTAKVAEQLGRKWIGIDIDIRNKALQDERLRQPSLELEIA